jgi:hypothetical protein
MKRLIVPAFFYIAVTFRMLRLIHDFEQYFLDSNYLSKKLSPD